MSRLRIRARQAVLLSLKVSLSSLVLIEVSLSPRAERRAAGARVGGGQPRPLHAGEPRGRRARLSRHEPGHPPHPTHTLLHPPVRRASPRNRYTILPSLINLGLPARGEKLGVEILVKTRPPASSGRYHPAHSGCNLPNLVPPPVIFCWPGVGAVWSLVGLRIPECVTDVLSMDALRNVYYIRCPAKYI